MNFLSKSVLCFIIAVFSVLFNSCKNNKDEITPEKRMPVLSLDIELMELPKPAVIIDNAAVEKITPSYIKKQNTDLGIRLNTLGMEYYGKKQYGEAAGCFEQSIIVYPNYILPHYNLACTLNLMRDAGDDIPLNIIKGELIIALNLNPETGGRQKGWAEKRMWEDSDLSSLWEIPDFKSFFDTYTPTAIEYTIEKLLDSTGWFGGIFAASFCEDKSFSGGVYMESGYREGGTWKFNNDDKTEILIYNVSIAFEDLRGGGHPLWPEPTPTHDILYKFDMEKMLMYIGDHEVSTESPLFGYGDIMFQHLYNNKIDYSAIIQIINSGFPVNCDTAREKYVEENFINLHSADIHGNSGVFAEVLRTKDIPLIRLFLGYLEEIDEYYLEELKKISEDLYLSYINADTQ
jgi:hypothetical protein